MFMLHFAWAALIQFHSMAFHVMPCQTERKYKALQFQQKVLFSEHGLHHNPTEAAAAAAITTTQVYT